MGTSVIVPLSCLPTSCSLRIRRSVLLGMVLVILLAFPLSISWVLECLDVSIHGSLMVEESLLVYALAPPIPAVESRGIMIAHMLNHVPSDAVLVVALEAPVSV